MDVLFLNAHAGTLRRAPDLAGAIAERARARSPEVRIVEDAPDLSAAARDAIAAGARLLVVCGGDGSISAVAGAVAGRDAALGVVPVGTLNHFARDLALPGDVQAAVDVAFGARERQVDVGRVGARVFINNCSLGIYPTLVAARTRAEQDLGGVPLARLPATLPALGAALRDFPLETLRVAVDDEPPREVATPLVFVGNNRYALGVAGGGRREQLDGGVLTLAIARSTSQLGLLGETLEAMLLGPDGAPGLEYRDARRVRIERPTDVTSRLAIDGEVTELPAPLEFAVMPGALRVRVC